MCEWRAMRFFVLLGFLAIGKSCSDLDLRTTAFTSKEAVLATRTVVIVEGEAKCRNKESLDLFIELNGQLSPVARNPETDSFQGTFVFDHKDLPKGDHNVRFYDELGAAAFRRASKTGGDENAVTPLFTVTVKHKGISTTPWIYSETIVLLAASSLTLGAFLTKNKAF
ncbi:SWI/SNF and RSC complex subunit Ssr4 [Clonorchis sinensis]|uniref:Translocon-associated protein subunit delta n=1 Tax=Clonorchis sinensis TaxID=79923 RepID=A0A8T1MPM4_CLOSI|nr:SWI/SNF and RSC complex subunit Ssr4 [Clonorchis sinensis]